jgi:hypothetical protein
MVRYGLTLAIAVGLAVWMLLIWDSFGDGWNTDEPDDPGAISAAWLIRMTTVSVWGAGTAIAVIALYFVWRRPRKPE